MRGIGLSIDAIEPRLGPSSQDIKVLDAERAAVLHDIVARAAELKPTNPKDAIGTNKIPFHLWPETATILGCLGLLDGMLKYGRANWREAGVRWSIYYDAMRRHMNKRHEGEIIDPDSGLPHMAHVLACAAIIADAEAAGQLVDDSQYVGPVNGYTTLITAMTPHVARLKEVHKDKNPHHYTAADRKHNDNVGSGGSHGDPRKD